MRDFRFNGGFPKRKCEIFGSNGGFVNRKRDFRLNGGFAKRKHVILGLNMELLMRKRVIFA